MDDDCLEYMIDCLTMDLVVIDFFSPEFVHCNCDYKCSTPTKISVAIIKMVFNYKLIVVIRHVGSCLTVLLMNTQTFLSHSKCDSL